MLVAAHQILVGHYGDVPAVALRQTLRQFAEDPEILWRDVEEGGVVIRQTAEQELVFLDQVFRFAIHLPIDIQRCQVSCVFPVCVELLLLPQLFSLGGGQCHEKSGFLFHLDFFTPLDSADLAGREIPTSAHRFCNFSRLRDWSIFTVETKSGGTPRPRDSQLL